MINFSTIVPPKLVVSMFRKNLETFFKRPVTEFGLFYDKQTEEVKVIFEGKKYSFDDGKILVKQAVKMYDKADKKDSDITYIFERAYLKYKDNSCSIDLFYSENDQKKTVNHKLY